MTPATLERPVAPERSLVQRRTALKRANVVRTRRAALKRDVSGGRVSVVAVLLDVPEWAETMKLVDLLMAVPKFGQIKVAKALRACEASPSKTLVGLSRRQREAVVSWLRGWPS